MIIPTPYDEFDYPSSIYPFTHPARLGVVARLFGREVAPFETSRVLEVGGGDGANVVAMALGAPRATFLNFDLAEAAIARGRGIVAALRVANARQERMDIVEAATSLGEYDYVIVHGVYAWVPPTVREALMDLLARVLSPRGIAMVSYNALPGCHVRAVTRDIARMAARGIAEPRARCAAARAALRDCLDRWSEADATLAAVRAEAERMLGNTDGVLFHDELSEDWHPRYVSDVAAAARARGLDYLGDTRPGLAEEALFGVAERDLAVHDQRDDFTAMRGFRQTLICRAGAPFDRRFDPARLDGLFVDGRLEASEKGDGVVAWRAPMGGELETRDPALNAALARVAEAWPESVAIEEVARDAETRESLTRLWTAGMVGFSTWAFPVRKTPGERPRANRMARAGAAAGSVAVASGRHELARLDDDRARRFLSLLDGARTRDEIVAEVAAWGLSRADAERQVAGGLAALARMGLIEA